MFLKCLIYQLLEKIVKTRYSVINHKQINQQREIGFIKIMILLNIFIQFSINRHSVIYNEPLFQQRDVGFINSILK